MNKNIFTKSFYLTGRTSFVQGIGQLFDIADAMKKYNLSKTEKEADAKALYLDWLAVGDDLRSAMNSYVKRSL